MLLLVLLEGAPIDSRVRLAIFLRYAAGGMTLDLEEIYHVSRGECYRSIWRVVDAINGPGGLEVDYPWEDPAKLAVLEAEFRARSRTDTWVGQVGAIDGFHFPTISPGVAVLDPRAYYVARKKCFAMLTTAVCDADRHFTYWDFGCTPTTHDSTAFLQSTLGRTIMTKGLPGEYFLNGDSAYAVGPHMAVPFGKTSQTDFDFYQSSNRMAIECAFGILIRRSALVINVTFTHSISTPPCAYLYLFIRWGVLWRPLEVAHTRRAPLIGCLMRLHNYCIDHRIFEQEFAAMDGKQGIPVPDTKGHAHTAA